MNGIFPMSSQKCQWQFSGDDNFFLIKGAHQTHSDLSYECQITGFHKLHGSEATGFPANLKPGVRGQGSKTN